MASFNLQWRTSTKKDLRKIPREMVSRIVAEVEKLGDEPLQHGSEKTDRLRAHLPDSRRRLSRGV